MIRATVCIAMFSPVDLSPRAASENREAEEVVFQIERANSTGKFGNRVSQIPNAVLSGVCHEFFEHAGSSIAAELGWKVADV